MVVYILYIVNNTLYIYIYLSLSRKTYELVEISNKFFPVNLRIRKKR